MQETDATTIFDESQIGFLAEQAKARSFEGTGAARRACKTTEQGDE